MNEEEKEYRIKFDGYLLSICKKYNLKITAIELGFLRGLLYDYINDEANKNKGVHIAEEIQKKISKITDKFYK